jgi:hypothetical protein
VCRELSVCCRACCSLRARSLVIILLLFYKDMVRHWRTLARIAAVNYRERRYLYRHQCPAADLPLPARVPGFLPLPARIPSYCQRRTSSRRSGPDAFPSRCCLLCGPMTMKAFLHSSARRRSRPGPLRLTPGMWFLECEREIELRRVDL